MSDNCTILREKTAKQRNNCDGMRTVSRIDLALEFHAKLAPSPLYYSGRMKKLGEPVFYAFLFDPATGTIKHNVIEYHEDEIGTLYVDDPKAVDTGIILPTVLQVSFPGSDGPPSLAQLLAELLHDRHWTQARLSRELELPAPRISEYLKGKRPLTIDLAQRLFLRLQVSAERLLSIPLQ